MCVLQANAHLLLSRVRQAIDVNLQSRMPPQQAAVGAGPEGVKAGTQRSRAGRTSHTGAATPVRGFTCATTARTAARAPTPGEVDGSERAIVDGRPRPGTRSS